MGRTRQAEADGRAAPVLEVIACSVADAVAAERGGADRLEVISHFERGGLTPPFELVRDILAAVSLPLRVMVRETENFSVDDPAEVARLCQAAGRLAALPLDGLVLGFVRNDEVDLELTRRVLACAPNLKATFHHAFETVPEPRGAIASLKQCGQVDRILTHAGPGEWPGKIGRLTDTARIAQPEITVLAGGGLDSQAIKSICAGTPVREFHVGRAARRPAQAAGAVDASLVRGIVAVIRASCA